MIRVACTNCKTVLLIDDAFAGGVCRCQHCGTIQTVPARAKEGTNAGVVSGQAVGGAKVRYQGEGRVENAGLPSGTGLDDLASAVASSGLVGSGLQSRRLTRSAPAPAAPPRRNLLPVVLAVAATAAVMLGVVIWLLLRPTPPAAAVALPNIPNLHSPGDVAPPPAPAQPMFCGIPLEGDSVVYVLDRGSSAKEIFPALEDATLKSLRSLGPNRRFQVLFWSNGSEDPGYPPASTTYATPENIEAAHRAIDAVAVFGASDAKPAIQQALASNPDLIVVATPKGWALDANWAAAMLKLRGEASVKIDTVSLGSTTAGDGLRILADRTGGRFTQVGDSDLRSFGGS